MPRETSFVKSKFFSQGFPLKGVKRFATGLCLEVGYDLGNLWLVQGFAGGCQERMSKHVMRISLLQFSYLTVALLGTFSR